MTETRQNGLDALKILACLFVISYHIGPSFESASFQPDQILRMLGRWAVPFFFVTSGYFWAHAQVFNATQTARARLFKLLRLIVVANLIFFVAPYVMDRIDPTYASDTMHLRSPRIAWRALTLSGWVHLWFLQSMAGSFVLLWALNRWAARAIPGVAGIFFLFSWLWAICAYPSLTAPIMFCIGLPFLALGHALGAGKGAITPRQGLWLCLIGLFLLPVEYLWIRANGLSPAIPNLTIGASLITIGLFALALRWRAAPTWLARWGARDSSAIYITHPLWIPASHAMMRAAGWDDQSLWETFVVFGLSAGSLWALGRASPRLRAALDGRFS